MEHVDLGMLEIIRKGFCNLDYNPVEHKYRCVPNPGFIITTDHILLDADNLEETVKLIEWDKCETVLGLQISSRFLKFKFK